jgi:hypothetical protein
MVTVGSRWLAILSCVLTVGVVVTMGGAGAGCGGGSSGGTGGASARGGTGGVSGTGGPGGGTGGASGTGGSLAGSAGRGGGAGGTGGAAGGAVDAGFDGGDSDAAVCSPSNYLFDCPEHFACDATTLRCTTKCSDAQPCRGGCCKGGTCQIGTEMNACGHDGMTCTTCSAGLEDGPLCLPWPYTDSPTRPGGYCGCMTSTDCTDPFSNVCQPELTLTRRCCSPANTSCSVSYPRGCCSGVCAAGTCG